MPHLSIIIPSYNYGLYIGEAINSVINQSYKDFEIIVIDDGSTDDTRENIETHYSNVVKYCYQDNKGPGAARNKGLKHVRGQFIVFLETFRLKSIIYENILMLIGFFRMFFSSTVKVNFSSEVPNISTKYTVRLTFHWMTSSLHC
jgi:hypothetical protein